jgi:hypothetical protein
MCSTCSSCQAQPGHCVQELLCPAYRLACSIGPHNECKGLVEFNGCVVFGGKAPDALYEHLQRAMRATKCQ